MAFFRMLTFNRTIVELKLRQRRPMQPVPRAFNRTIVELKYRSHKATILRLHF